MWTLHSSGTYALTHCFTGKEGTALDRYVRSANDVLFYSETTIATLCSMTVLHRVQEETEKLAELFGLSEREVNWVGTAKGGNDQDGFSEALLGVDEEGWFPIRVRASEFEADVIG